MIFAALGLWTLTGCGFTSSSNGELGNLNYRLNTDFDAQGQIDDIALITRYAHIINVNPTESGERKWKDADDVIETFSADANVMGFTDGSFEIRRESAGVARVETYLNDELLDAIELSFDDPGGLDLVVWSHPANGDGWIAEDPNGPMRVSEGSHVTFLAVPVSFEGERIAANFVPEITPAREGLMVPAIDVSNVLENQVLSGTDPVTFVAIEPGTADLEIVEPVHQVSTTARIEIISGSF